MSSSQIPFPFEERRSFAREDFVPGATNELALVLVDTWPEWPQRVCALWGPTGSGKTHLAQIWRAQADAIELRDLTREVVAGLPAGGAFLLDDADMGDGGEALFHLINFVNQTSGWLLMTGKQAPQRWTTTVPDLHSRLTAVPGAALEAPDEALIARVLLKLFADRQLKLPEALIGYLAPRLRRSFAEAERIVVLIDTLALQQKRNISVEIGAQALRQLEAERPADNG
ncbi:MAG: chromosomal replication initiator DnaA [Alphaproteobacteria bacterium]|nr:chromosomal replication initiator DnaA [Alphaproteobacteria bacterium]